MFNNLFNSQSQGRHILPPQFRQGKPEAESFDFALTIIGGIVAIGGGIISLVAGVRKADEAFAHWDAKHQK